MTRKEVAQVIFEFWRNQGLSPQQAIAWVGNTEGEEGLRDPVPVGDRGEAFGLVQWHWQPRGAAIFKGTGIDVRKANIAEQCRAAYWELTNREHAAWGYIKRAKTVEDTVSAIVRYYERSANQTSDIQKRTAYAMGWARELGVIP